MGGRFSTLLGRSLRLRCPLCGEGKQFATWWKMNDRCPHCGVKFQREPGFFLGSIYISYGLTAVVVAIGYPVLLFREVLSNDQLLILFGAWTILFPLWFFPYARSLWLGFDQFHDPRPGEVPGDAQQPPKSS